MPCRQGPLEQIQCWIINHFFTKLPVVLSCCPRVPFLLFIPNLLSNIQYVQDISNVQGNPLQFAPSDGSPLCIHFSLQYLPFQRAICLESCALLVILTNTMKVSGEYNKIQPIFEISVFIQNMLGIMGNLKMNCRHYLMRKGLHKCQEMRTMVDSEH